MIGLKNVYKSYGDRKVFPDLSIEFEPNRITAVLGGSGVGKTTILRLLSGLTKPDSGEVFGAKPVSFVFQEDRLVPHLTVNQNLELVLGKGDYSAELASVGLDGRGNDYPKNLSGGMARRLCFLRASLFPSELILLDEPFKGLDLKLKYSVMDTFLDLWKKNPRTPFSSRTTPKKPLTSLPARSFSTTAQLKPTFSPLPSTFSVPNCCGNGREPLLASI